MLNKKNGKIIFSIAGVVFLLSALNLFTYFSEEDKAHQNNFKSHYKIFALNIPEKLNFAGENVPVANFDVREKFDRELLVNTYWQSQSLLFIKRSNKWFPIIEEILKRNNVPDDFKYLALIESGLMNVVSPAGATGFWQILKSTGKEYGLIINKEVDERYHVEKSTQFACDYLQRAYKNFGSWTLAAASYNMGISGLKRQIKRQKVKNYYDLLLNEETGRYVYRILAAKEIISNASNYGFSVRKKDLYPTIDYKVVEVDSTVDDLADFAFDHRINYKTLKIFNPWLRQNYLENSELNSYKIKIPTDTTKFKVYKQNYTLDTLLYTLDSSYALPSVASIASDTLINN